MRSDTTPSGFRDLSAIWAATQDRITALVDGVPDVIRATAVPTVPGGTVGDVVAHLIDTAVKACDAPRDLCRGAITAAPVGAASPGSTLADEMSVWEKLAAALHGRVESDVGLASFLITDAVMCEHDLRTTLDVPGARDDIAVKVALDELSGRFSDRVEAAGLPPLRVTVEQWGTIIGNGQAGFCVVADRFEFVRAMAGRRSAPEIRQWNWGVEPDTYFAAISEVALPPHEIHERDPRIPQHMRDREFVL